MSHLHLAILHSLWLTQRKLRDIPSDIAQEYYEKLGTSLLVEAGYTVDSATRIVDKKTSKLVEHVEHTLTKYGIHVVHRDDEIFPASLRELADCPTILYVRWKLPSNDALISIVGSRKHSQYAESCLEKIIPELISAGYGIVSGGAYGIDSIAHRVSLKNKGYTAAVFGAGVDVYYPTSNHHLFEEIVAHGGALISQFPLGTIAEPFHFPIRNAVVAGISRGTLIAEAGEDSGTLITARLALESNRDVFALPADITRTTALGSNALIRDGLAKLITHTSDILSEYQLVDKQMSLLSQAPVFDDPLHARLYEMLCMDSLWIDMLVEKSGSDSVAVMNALAVMEIDGIVTMRGGMYRVI